MLWSYVDIAKLTRAEVADLVADAWTTIVPEKVSSANLAGRS
jgi:hypothetical protein